MSNSYYAAFHARLFDRVRAGSCEPLVRYLMASMAGEEVPAPLPADADVARVLADDIGAMLRMCATSEYRVGSVIRHPSTREATFLMAGYVHEEDQGGLYGLAALIAPWSDDQHLASWTYDLSPDLPTQVFVHDGVAYTWSAGGGRPAYAIVHGDPKPWPQDAWAADVLGG